MRNASIPVLIAALVCGGAAVASADPAAPVVLASDGAAIYVSLGGRDGVGEGSTLELLHEVVVHDPRTGAVLRDHFAIGTLVVEKSGDHLSLARADADTAGRVVAGDGVRLVSPARVFDDPWAAQVAASKAAHAPAPVTTTPTTTTVDHAAIAEAAWQATLGRAPGERIARWQELLARDPRTPYRRAIEAEIASLVEQDAELAAARAMHAIAQGAEADRTQRIAKLAASLAGEAIGTRVALAPIARVVPGKPLDLAFLVRDPTTVALAWLYVRATGEQGYHRMPMAPGGDAYLTVRVPGEQVRGPALEWYVETARAADDPPAAAIGGAAAPETIAVDDSVAEAPIAAGRTHVDAHADYVDFDGKQNKGFDQYYLAEVDFGYRFLEPIHAVRLGFGTLSGTGGPKDVIDKAPTTCISPTTNQYMCKNVTFSYVYLELEHHIRDTIAVMIRPQAGLLTTDTAMTSSSASRCQKSDTSDCDFFTGYGLRARLRLGRETGTNLVLGAGFTARVGTLFEAAYNWRPRPVLPVQLAVQVTDMPSTANYGVRLLADVGYRVADWFYPSLRVSYQARDLDHSGVSGGFAMNFDW